MSQWRTNTSLSLWQLRSACTCTTSVQLRSQRRNSVHLASALKSEAPHAERSTSCSSLSVPGATHAIIPRHRVIQLERSDQTTKRGHAPSTEVSHTDSQCCALSMRSRRQPASGAMLGSERHQLISSHNKVPQPKSADMSQRSSHRERSRCCSIQSARGARLNTRRLAPVPAQASEVMISARLLHQRLIIDAGAPPRRAGAGTGAGEGGTNVRNKRQYKSAQQPAT